MGRSLPILVPGIKNFEMSPTYLEKCINGFIHKERREDEGYRKPGVSVRFVH